MKIGKKEYGELVKKVSPPSPKLKNLCAAFLVGGTICTLGQIFFYIYKNLKVETDMAYGLASMTIIFITAILTMIGCFDKIAKFGGAGTLVPISGFANATVSPAIEFKSEGIISGTSVKMFVITGPVIVFGLSAGVILGIILYFSECVF